tara:strand:- start:13622 stop:13855 length:234 start_codon:yes stop_codon:yes gene_type:complete
MKKKQKINERIKKMKTFNKKETKHILMYLVGEHFRKQEKYHKGFQSSDIKKHTTKLQNLLTDIQNADDILIKKGLTK